MPTPKELIDIIYCEENLCRIDSEYKKYKVYNGQLRKQVSEAISKEFILPETVKELNKRIIPVNITQKVINKLAMVYKNSPLRTSTIENEEDNNAIQFLADTMQMDLIGKSTNRLFKLNKSGMLEPYVDYKGKPSLRSIPNHMFTVASDDPIDPTRATHVVKHLNMGSYEDGKQMVNERANHIHVVWSDTEHYTMDGEGNIIDNPGNEYGVNPMTYIKEGDCLMPIPDDDLYFLQIAICLLLTDLAFASKYQAWSIIYIIGAETQNLTFNPSSVVTLPMGRDGTKPDIGTIKPTLDTQALLSQVEALIGLLLTTKSLSIGSVTMKLEAGNTASGISKMLDESHTTEDQKDQQAYFVNAEEELWKKMATNILPAWINAGAIDPKYIVNFSQEFEPRVIFTAPEIPLSKQEVVELEKLKLDARLTTKKMALREVHDDLNDDEIEDLILEMNQEGLDSLNGIQSQFENQSNDASQ